MKRSVMSRCRVIENMRRRIGRMDKWEKMKEGGFFFWAWLTCYVVNDCLQYEDFWDKMLGFAVSFIAYDVAWFLIGKAVRKRERKRIEE